MKKLFLVFVCMFLAASFAYSGINVSGTVKDYGSENTISGATIGITGTKITATSGTGGNFTLQNVPYDSFVVELKASKSGYKTTYTMPTGFGERDEAGFNIMLFSNTFYNNNLHGGNAPSHTPGKGDIAGLVHRIGEAGGDIPIDGVAITAKYLDTGGQIPSTQIKYLNSSGSGFIDSSTSSQGIFIIYNVDPGRGVKITASKSGTAFNSPIAICYADCITMGDVQVTGGNITIGGYVGDENENPVNGATVSILGTGTSATTNSKGEFTFSNTYDFSPGVIKLSKTNYKDTYFVGFISSEDEEEDEGGIELTIISTNIYNELLSQLGVSHTTGKGDIIGCVGEDYDISGAEVKVYDENGDEVNANIYYFNEDGQPDASLTKTTSDSNFLILNLTPGFYYITAVKENFEFQLVGIPVFANGITMEDELIDWPPIQSLEKQAPSMQIQETEITSSATDVSILKFNLLASYPELFNSYFQEQKDVKIESIKFKIDGTGDVSTCISSAKLYYSDPWSESNYTFAGIATSITKNEILIRDYNTHAAGYLIHLGWDGNTSDPTVAGGVEISSLGSDGNPD
ncbi:MAG TPA: carboxypeptidase-like regulatory domain-containing protein, partial [Candidatus Ratteibacteria bacterium]|nr:carboxypeptidase-like regulatory domain-containing protein [Candidatus Ratteibacteria bacterium]